MFIYYNNYSKILKPTVPYEVKGCPVGLKVRICFKSVHNIAKYTFQIHLLRSDTYLWFNYYVGMSIQSKLLVQVKIGL